MGMLGPQSARIYFGAEVHEVFCCEVCVECHSAHLVPRTASLHAFNSLCVVDSVNLCWTASQTHWRAPVADVQTNFSRDDTQIGSAEGGHRQPPIWNVQSLLLVAESECPPRTPIGAQLSTSKTMQGLRKK